MSKKGIWIVLCIIGFIIIIGSDTFTRWIGTEVSWNIVGSILSLLSGVGIICDIYFNR